MNDLIQFDINSMVRNADAVVICTVETPQLSIHTDAQKMYHAIVVNSLKGAFRTDLNIVTYTGLDAPVLESETPYLFFLKQSKIPNNESDSSLVCEVLGNWKGVIPLSSAAKETRTKNFLEKNFGIDIFKMTAGFTDAIRYVFNQDDIDTVKQALHIYTIAGKKMTALVEKSDIVAAVKIDKVDEPYEVLGRWFYRMSLLEKIRGTIEENHFLEIVYNVDSHWGLEPDPESGLPFIVFLKTVPAECGAPQNFLYYHLVDHWKGLIALDENSKEQRASDEIKKSLGLNAGKMNRSFCMALQFCADNARFNDANNAVFIYNTLKLKRFTD